MRFITFLALFFITFYSSSQQRFRIKAEFTTKEKKPNGKSFLGKGTVYFDKNFRKLVYQNSFPERDFHVFLDSVSYNIANNKIIETGPSLIPIDFSIFSMTLNNNLAQFGLSENYFTLEKVEKKDSLVISTWSPKIVKAKKNMKIMISTKNKQLYAVAVINTEGKVMMKQFYRKYQLVKGVDFPTEIVQINYKDDKEYYQVNTYKNIKIDEFSENDMYNFTIPAK
jgi:hypothetical protein